jgi:hypothetical protein
MADIPPPIAASAAQVPFQSKAVADAREARRAGQTHAAQRQVKTVDESGTTVETADADSRVFTDAEGSGSQGRELEREVDDAPVEPEGNLPKTGIITGEDGRLHIDLEA